jgi:hypothetical protein
MPLALLVLIASAWLPAPARGQGQTIDLGSGAAYTVFAHNDPASFERFPPFAFGRFEPGVWFVYVELVPRSCSSLPWTEICDSGQFVGAFEAFMTLPSNCPCSGVLIEPVYLELHYDPRLVIGRESELRLTHYDEEAGDWVELDEQRVVAERDVVTGSLLGHARQFYAILLSGRAGEDSTWGRIKSQWVRG